jgi:integrase
MRLLVSKKLKKKKEVKRNMAKGIYKRGNVYWIRYAGLDGRVIRESSSSEKFRNAEALLIKRRQAIKEGKEPEVIKIGKHDFKELAIEYVKWAERQRCFSSKKFFIAALNERFGNIPLRRFNSMILEQFQTEKLNSGYKPATVNRHIATIKHMLTKAVDWNMAEEEVLKRIRKVKLLQENNKRLRYLSVDECQNLINCCDEHLKPIVITALNTEMRKSEVLNLKWDNVDLKHGFILLEITKNGERREIPINTTLRVVLQGLTRRLDIPYVFYNPITGKPFTDAKRSFHSALKKARIKDFHFHDQRHTFASHLVMAGVDLTTIKELLGHKTLTMTLRYAHLAPSHKVKAVDLLDSTMNCDSTAQLLHSL